MPRAIIIYFSQSGTTAQVAAAIAAGLRKAGYAVESANLRDGPPPDIGSYDLLGIGSPVYHFGLPFNVADYLQSLPRLAGMPAFCFLVHGIHAFDTVNSLRRPLAQRAAKDVGYFHCHGEAHFLGNLMEGYLFFPDRPSPDELARATAFGVAVAQRVAEGTLAHGKEEPKPPLVYRIERGLMSRWLVAQVYSRLFKVDPNRCTACGLCMDICPTRNIHKNQRGHPLWGRNCLGCFYCEMKCPEEAIDSALGHPVIGMLARPFLRYNVRHWAREAEHDYVRVILKHGRTERLDSRSTHDAPGKWRPQR